jgi:hypothetical protein|tara:strand:+ start:145 stop:750 length:606 start_codon:yes stop_codon:yes gene_type:complete
MKKIKTLYKLDPSTHIITNEVIESSIWVLEGLGIATEKFDGTSCLIKNGKIYRRFDRKTKRKLGKIITKDLTIEDFKDAPEGFIECDRSSMQKGHIMGWVECKLGDPQDRWHNEAFENTASILDDGTYELVGEKINGNFHNLKGHALWKHGSKIIDNVPTAFEDIKEFLRTFEGEGIVWHKKDNDNAMVKIRRADFKFNKL